MITSELRTDSGRTLVVKRADPAVAVDAGRLAREATLLAMARHPGVVALAEPAESTGSVEQETEGSPALELRTVFAGARTLAAPDLEPDAAARALAAAASTVADLHALGLVHGRIDPDHVVLTGSGRAVLCGFAEAGLAGDLRGDGQVLVPSLDVAALGALLRRVLADATGSPDARRSGIDRSAAARLAQRATATDPALRPSARTFAAGLAACLPAPPAARTRPSLPTDRPAPDRSRAVDRSVAEPAAAAPAPAAPSSAPPRRPGRRALAVAGAAIAVVSLGVGADALADLPSGHGADMATSPTTAPAPVEEPAVGDPPRPGGQLDIDGHQLDLGTADDQVLHAVWACTEPSAVVLVRPDGSVFRFDRLATPGQDVTGVLVGRVPERSTVQLVTGADGCLALQARAGDRTETLSIPAAPPSPTPA